MNRGPSFPHRRLISASYSSPHRQNTLTKTVTPKEERNRDVPLQPLRRPCRSAATTGDCSTSPLALVRRAGARVRPDAGCRRLHGRVTALECAGGGWSTRLAQRGELLPVLASGRTR